MAVVKGLHLVKKGAMTAAAQDRLNDIIDSGRAGWAGAEQKYLLALNDKTLRGRFLFVQGAARQFVNPVASVTMEMMVMPFACTFIQRTEQGMADLGDVPFLHQQFKRPIDGGQVE